MSLDAEKHWEVHYACDVRELLARPVPLAGLPDHWLDRLLHESERPGCPRDVRAELEATAVHELERRGGCHDLPWGYGPLGATYSVRYTAREG